MREITLCFVIALAACTTDAPEPDVATDGDRAPYWATNTPTEEAGSTHLWIVDRSIDVLGAHLDVAAAGRARAWMTNASCRTRWQQGLYDADYRHQYNGGWFDLTPTSSAATIAASGATWASHFYDPDTGRNWEGDTSPTAKTEATSHLSAAKKKLAAGSMYDGCYELGLALHYFTDLTQPMHASNFTAADTPIQLHSHLEEYALQLQTFGAPTTWSTPTGKLSAFIDDAGRRSKSQWGPMESTIASAYGARCGFYWLYVNDNQSCWEHDAAVDAKIVASMANAITDTARFLVIANLP